MKIRPIVLSMVSAVVLTALPTVASAACVLQIDGFFNSVPAQGFKSWETTAEVKASVESESGHWLKSLAPIRQGNGRATGTHTVTVYQFRLDDPRFCEQGIQVRLDGFCRTTAVTLKGQRVRTSIPMKTTWVPGYNKLTSQKRLKAELCP